MAKKGVLILAVVLIAPVSSIADPAFAQHTDYGHITALHTGSWGLPLTLPGLQIAADDTITVDLDVRFTNSAYPFQGVTLPGHAPTRVPCEVTNGGYALDPKDPGTKVNESVLLSAFLNGKKVSLFLNGCVFNKPRIVSVSMSNTQN
jgi:hypothetical protein